MLKHPQKLLKLHLQLFLSKYQAISFLKHLHQWKIYGWTEHIFIVWYSFYLSKLPEYVFYHCTVARNKHMIPHRLPTLEHNTICVRDTLQKFCQCAESEETRAAWGRNSGVVFTLCNRANRTFCQKAILNSVSGQEQNKWIMLLPPELFRNLWQARVLHKKNKIKLPSH